MLYHEQSEDYRPLFWFQGRPVYANTLLVIAHVVLFIVCGICISILNYDTVQNALELNTAAIWHGQVWRLFSYIAYDPQFFAQRSFWFLISMLILYFFGREVEQLVGRKSYLLLYAGLVLIPAVLITLVGYFSASPWVHLNCAEVIFGVFVAFATIYPGAMPSMWVPIQVWVLAWILGAISTFLDFVNHDYAAIFILWSASAVGYLGMRYVGAGRGLNWLTDWIEERRARKLARKHQFKIVTDRQAAESIDAILEKISRQGVNSLNAQERAALERARTKLIDRDRR